jgi:hypothetical protein
LPVSGFDPVLVEASLGFVVQGLREQAFWLEAAMDEPVGSRLLLSLPSFCLLALGAKVDDVAHPEARL